MDKLTKEEFHRMPWICLGAFIIFFLAGFSSVFRPWVSFSEAAVDGLKTGLGAVLFLVFIMLAVLIGELFKKIKRALKGGIN